MAYEFILGVDVVTTHDADGLTATFTMVEKTDAGGDGAPRYSIDRLAAGHAFASTDALADHIQSVLTQKPYVARTVPIINQTTNAGEAVRAALEDRGLAPVGATLSDSTTTLRGGRDEMRATVSLHRILDTLQALHRGGRVDLNAQKDTDEASRLVRAIEWYSESGTDEDGEERRVAMARTPDAEGPYEPLVVSAAFACWLGEEQSFDPTEHLRKDLHGRRSAPEDAL